ncbi:MAG: ABC transporter substrate-binding protein [Thermoprotei archaeon]
MDDAGLALIGHVVPPDALDPATGFYVPDGAVFTNVFQNLVEFNASNYLQVVPVIAQNYSTTNYQNYVFNIRPNVTFSNGDTLNAYDVWFSLVREVYMGQAVGLANYGMLTVNLTEYSQTGYAFPWGIRHAMQAVTGLPATTNVTLAVRILNNMLSNFNPDNQTIRQIMSYPDQAYVASGPLTFKANLLNPYRDFPLALAGWWGAIVDPSFVDSHGGVQANTQNSYFNSNGGIGSGPYMIKSVTPGFTQVVLVANPHYWAVNQSNVPAVVQPPHIDTVVINYGLSHNQRVEDFATNRAQISFVSISSFNQFYDAYQYKQYFSFNQIFYNAGFQPGVVYLAMNTQEPPTNNNYFRLAIVHAINYTQILNDLYTFNGTLLGQMYLGPVSPQFPQYYNPGNLPQYTYNLSLAEYYLNLSGWQAGFHVVLPNGTIIGNPNAPQLQPLPIWYLAPLSTFDQGKLEIIQQDLQLIGISASLEGATPAVFASWTTPQATPNLVLLDWYPDWADPIFQQMFPEITTFANLPAWMNLTKVNQLLQVAPFTTNTTQQIQMVKEIYNITYWYAPYAWLPNSAFYYFVQPYLKGFAYNEFSGYYYNMMYYQPVNLP